MKFTIVGAGALGSILAAHLDEAGHEVCLVARGRRAAWIREHGIQLQGLRTLHVPCNPVTDPSTLKDTDVLILTPKTYHHQQALEQVRHVQASQVFSVANGVLKTEQITEVFGVAASLGCMANLSGELLEDGHVLFTRNVDLRIGALEDAYQAAAGRLATVIAQSGIHCSAVDDIRSIEWSKYVTWLAFLALSVTTRLESWKLLVDPGAATVLYRISREMVELARRMDIPLVDQSPAPALTIASAEPAEAMAIIRKLGEEMKEKAPEHKMSALQDLENGRPLELEETMGDALQKARAVGLEMPTVEACYQLLRAINSYQ